MIKPIRLSPSYAISSQLLPSDLADAKSAGFRTVLDVRYDDEDPGQPAFEEMARAADLAGIAIVHLPSASPPNDGQLREFVRLSLKLRKPVLAYCRSGDRARQLWKLTELRRGNL
ncbi:MULTISPECIES: beta-lactamase hydrolase domain-containing protein [Devosia]|uniref:beta-lactamase hydrolase domain-containing protein n=1 Tax=Devosia TaxID=46913 RepID=UPI000689748F|nr:MULTISPECIES: sulfur transferase domain-containing protein [Devosia]MBU1334356.1 TIGR01244 family phosphatase [Alphaproteobacteria bacterium]MBU1559700.1 TIGR01244 family phosphatase [Alphaproteobacteria bacterium]MBU2305079.1 TIGR01244 family phosphatase [Alphaproteobacteria bacterium]MBU2367884.1 TIGR01244 family phosphatase [Alphaproteobacteria bacterium]